MKHLITFIISLTFFSAFSQNSGYIQGSVTTSDGQPAQFVSVMIKGTERGTTTNENGQFIINGVKPGSQIIITSAVGIERNEHAAKIKPGQNKIDLIINISQQRLREVIISAEKTNKFSTRRSETVARLPLTNLENPQSYTTITQQLLKEQVITNFSDAIKNSPGLDKLWSSTGRGGDGAAYYNLRGFTTQAALVNGVAGLTNGDIDPAAIEKIEVIKGPSGTLFGGAITNFGGLINIVTKRPLDTLAGEVSYTTGSFGLNRITADFNTPVNQEKTLLFRLNTSYQDQNSWQDAGFKKSFFVAPAFQYKLNERATLDLGAEFYSYQGTNPLFVFLNRSRQLIARTPNQLNFDFGRSYTNNDLVIKTPTTNIHGQLNYKLSDKWTSQTNIAQSLRKSNGYYQYVMYIGASDDLLNRYINYQDSYSTSFDIQQNFTGDFSLGGLRNRVVIGVDYLNQYTNNDNSPYVLFDQVSSKISPYPSNYGDINRAAVDGKIAATTAGASKGNSESNVYSAYASNVLNVTDNLMAMLSIRVDRFNNKGSFNNLTGATSGDYLQTAWSPKFGLVYQPIKDKVSLFANYMNGFKNVAPGIQLVNGSAITAPFKPQHANQAEGGVKLDVFKNRLSLTASYYDISVDNTLRSETLTIAGTPTNVNVQDGTQASRGYELDLTANPVNGLNLIFGYSHNDSKMEKSSPQIEGRRPVAAGPEDLVNFWASYTLISGRAQGLGFGFGGNYASDNLITNTLATGVFTLPSYTVLNSTIFYNLSKLRVGLKVDNLTDERYYKGWTTVEAQQPRTFLANFAFKF